MRRIFLFILLISLIGGCSKKIENLDFNYNNLLIIKNGSKLIQDKEYEIVWNTQGLISDKFFCNLIYHFEREGNFQTKVIKLFRLDSNLFKCVIKIPPQTSWIYIGLSTSYSSLSCPYSIRLPVFKNESTPEFGANSVALLSANKNNYLKYFFNERKLYPMNYSVYVVRWTYEMENNIFVKDTILKQLKEIEKLGNSPDIQLIKLIGKSIVMDYSIHNEILNNLCESLKFSTCLNNWETAGILSNMLMNNLEKDSLKIKKLIDRIIRYNPYSHFVNSLISKGALTDKKIVNPYTALMVINKLLQRDSSYYFLIRKAMILALNFIPDSISQLNLIGHKLQKYYSNYFIDDEFYYKIQDYHHAFYQAIGLLPYIYKRLAFTTNEHLTFVNYLKDLDTNIVKNLSIKGILYYTLGELYEKMSLKDSALKYYYYSYALLPNATFAYSKLKTLVPKTEVNDFIKKANLLENRFGFPLTKIGNDMPLIEYHNGTKDNIGQWKVPKIILFFTTRCNSCEKILKELAMVKYLIEKKRIKLLFVSPEAPNVLSNLWIYNFFGADIITNPRQIKSFFGIDDNVPQVILIDSKNYIVNWINGYSTGNLIWDNIISHIE